MSETFFAVVNTSVELRFFSVGVTATFIRAEESDGELPRVFCKQNATWLPRAGRGV